MSSKIWVFDLETTGLGELGEPIVPVQIAWAFLDTNQPGMPEVGSGQRFLKIPAYAHIEEYAMNMHAQKGRTFEWFQANGQEPESVYRELDGEIRQHGNYLTPAGHNASGFDMPIFKREVKRWLGVKHKMPLDYHVMDTMSEALFRYKFALGQMKNVKLRQLCEFLGVPFNEAEAHDALYDVRATAECLRRMVDEIRKGVGVAPQPHPQQLALPFPANATQNYVPPPIHMQHNTTLAPPQYLVPPQAPQHAPPQAPITYAPPQQPLTFQAPAPGYQDITLPNGQIIQSAVPQVAPMPPVPGFPQA